MNQDGMGNYRENRNDWRRSVAAGTWASLIVLAAVVLSRRWSGAFDHPVSVGAAALLAGVAAVLSVSAHWLDQTTQRDRMTRRCRIATGMATLVPPVLLGFALMPGHTTGSLVLLSSVFVVTSVGMFAVGELMPRLHQLERRMRRLVRGNANPGVRSGRVMRAEIASTESPRSAQPESPSKFFEVNVEADHRSSVPVRDAAQAMPEGGTQVEEQEQLAIHDGRPAGTLSQWMRRTTTMDGHDCMEGAIVVHFPAGHKHAAVHLPFSPPFPCPPDVACEAAGEGEIRLKVTAIHAFGARIEARRRSSADSEQSVSIHFFISDPVRSESEAA